MSTNTPENALDLVHPEALNVLQQVHVRDILFSNYTHTDINNL